jgi:hypothetical protein
LLFLPHPSSALLCSLLCSALLLHLLSAPSFALRAPFPLHYSGCSVLRFCLCLCECMSGALLRDERLIYYCWEMRDFRFVILLLYVVH